MDVPQRDEVCCPRIQSDIEDYRSPVGDHAVIGSRSAQREDLKRHDCVLVPPGPKKYMRNEKFAAKHGLTHRLEKYA
jgi:hypothetical protein